MRKIVSFFFLTVIYSFFIPFLFLFLLGQCLLRTATTGAEVSALDEFQIAVNLDQNNALAHAYIGFWYIFIQKFPEAKEELDKAEKLDAQSPEILTFLGMKNWKKWNEEKKINSKPTKKIGTYYESVGDDKKAEEYYRQAIPLSRSYLTARLSLSRTNNWKILKILN